MARTPTPQIGRPTAIQPVAAPVNTYVRPADPAPSSLHELAQGLSAFDAGLAGFLQKRREEQEKTDRIRGEAAFYQENGPGLAAGVASGAIPPTASPAFMEGLKQSQGRHIGIRIQEKWQQAYATWEGRNSDNPNAFDQFFTEFVQKELAGVEDTNVLTGLMPHIESLQGSAYTQYSTDRANTVYTQNLDTRAAIAGDIISHGSIQGLGLETGTDTAAIWADLMEERENALVTGTRAADYDKELVATIAAKTLEHRDPALLDLLEQTLPGSTVKISSLPDFRDIKATTIAALEVEARRMMSEDADRQKKEDQAAEDAIVRDIFTVLEKDPMGVIPEELVEQWSFYDPEARKKLAGARTTFLDNTALEDPADMIIIERMIQEGATVQDILDLAQPGGIISNPATFRTMLDRVNKRQDETVQQMLSIGAAKRVTATIKDRLTPPEFFSGHFDPDGWTDEGLEAVRDYEVMLIEWTANHPNATSYEREQFANEAGEVILKRVHAPPMETPEYISPKDAQRIREQEAFAAAQEALDDPFVPDDPLQSERENLKVPGYEPPMAQPSNPTHSQAPIEQEAAPAPAYQPNPEISDLYGKDTPPSFSTMDEISQRFIQERAEASGVTAEEYNMEIWKMVREGLGLGTDLPEGYVPTAASAPAQGTPTLTPISYTPTSADGFLEPSTNPAVNPQILQRWAGKRLPVSIRNNNMGAVSITGAQSKIMQSWAAQQPGFVGYTARPAAEGGWYAKYATPEHGVAAASKLLERYGQQGVNTAAAIVRKWSVDTAAHNSYANTLVKYLTQAGFNVTTASTLDLSDPNVRMAILKAKSAHESGAGIPVYTDAVFQAGAHYNLPTVGTSA